MNVTIIYFSQTGHTRSVAQAMAEAIREKGHTARTVPLGKATPQDAATGDVLAVGTPCFSSQAPTPVKAFLRSLPPLGGKPALVFATSGGAPGRVLYDLTRLLRGKGADVIGGFLTRGELVHPTPCLTGRMPQRPNAEDLSDARRFAAEAIDHIASHRPGPMAGSRPDALRPGRGFYDLVGSLSTDGFLRLVLPEPKPDPTRCNGCQWCVHECPTDNITLVPEPVLGRECIRCYRCVTGCPQQAADADWTLGNLAVLAFYNTTFERWFGDLQPGEQLYADG